MCNNNASHAWRRFTECLHDDRYLGHVPLLPFSISHAVRVARKEGSGQRENCYTVIILWRLDSTTHQIQREEQETASFNSARERAHFLFNSSPTEVGSAAAGISLMEEEVSFPTSCFSEAHANLLNSIPQTIYSLSFLFFFPVEARS